MRRRRQWYGARQGCLLRRHRPGPGQAQTCKVTAAGLLLSPPLAPSSKGMVVATALAGAAHDPGNRIRCRDNQIWRPQKRDGTHGGDKWRRQRRRLSDRILRPQASGGQQRRQQVPEPAMTAGNGFGVRQCYACGSVSRVTCVARSEGVAADTSMRLLRTCSQRVEVPLVGLLWDGRTVTTTMVACYGPSSWPDVVLGDTLGECLGDGDTRGRHFLCWGCRIPLQHCLLWVKA